MSENITGRLTNGLLAALTAGITAIGMLPFGAAAQPASTPTSFEHQVLPIVERHCVECHSPGGVGYQAILLDLRSYQHLMSGSRFGIAVIPGHPEHSPLVAVLQRKGHPFPLLQAYRDLKMPPLGPPLSSEELNTVIDWIREGAKNN